MIHLANGITSIPNHLFYGTGASRVTIPSSVVSIVNSIAPNSFDGYTTVYIAEGVTSIAQNLFAGTNVSSIVAPASIMITGFIGTNAFATNNVNTTVHIARNTQIIGFNRFANTGLRNIVIPDSVINIQFGAFSNNPNLRTVTIDQETGVPIMLTLGAFNNTNVQRIYLPNWDMVDAYRQDPYWISNFSSHIHGQLVFRYYIFTAPAPPISPYFDFTIIPNTTNVEIRARDGVILDGRVEIPSTVVLDGILRTITYIAANGFSGQGFYEIVIPNTIVKIGNNAFAHSWLQRITFQQGSQLQVIGDYAFAYSSITRFSISAILYEIGVGAFRNTNRLIEISVFGVRYIRRYAFANSNLTTFSMRDTHSLLLQYIGVGAFENSRNFRTFANLRVASSLTVIPDRVFYNTALTNVEYLYLLPHTITHIGNSAFYGTNLTRVVLPYSLESVGENAFRNSATLREVVVHRPVSMGLTELGANAFIGTAVAATSNSIIVSICSLGAYRLANNWSSLASRMTTLNYNPNNLFFDIAADNYSYTTGYIHFPHGGSRVINLNIAGPVRTIYVYGSHWNVVLSKLFMGGWSEQHRIDVRHGGSVASRSSSSTMPHFVASGPAGSWIRLRIEKSPYVSIYSCDTTSFTVSRHEEGVQEFRFRLVDSFALFYFFGNWGSFSVITDRGAPLYSLNLGQSVVIGNPNSEFFDSSSMIAGEFVRIRIHSSGSQGGMMLITPNSI
ncbi:MAG: leucine-rich repeat domain-containing protein [Defluviitaleaceae bacterium]|nr:leucine-rich repeat domain-containing protein [Defluviitaleaceae bacterium]